MSNTSILIADDDQVVLTMISTVLQDAGYNVTEATNGPDAVELGFEVKPDLAVLDICMPGMDGIETLREIKSLKPLTEVIMLTGHATVETAIEGMKLGALDYLMKPCETDELVDKINMAYQRKSDQEERIREAKVREIVSSPRSVLKDE